MKDFEINYESQEEEYKVEGVEKRGKKYYLSIGS